MKRSVRLLAVLALTCAASTACAGQPEALAPPVPPAGAAQGASLTVSPADAGSARIGQGALVSPHAAAHACTPRAASRPIAGSSIPPTWFARRARL